MLTGIWRWATSESRTTQTPSLPASHSFGKRKGKKLSNEDWESPTDSDVRIARRKDGTPPLAYRPDHPVDLDTGAIVATEIHAADRYIQSDDWAWSLIPPRSGMATPAPAGAGVAACVRRLPSQRTVSAYRIRKPYFPSRTASMNRLLVIDFFFIVDFEAFDANRSPLFDLRRNSICQFTFIDWRVIQTHCTDQCTFPIQIRRYVITLHFRTSYRWQINLSNKLTLPGFSNAVIIHDRPPFDLQMSVRFKRTFATRDKYLQFHRRSAGAGEGEVSSARGSVPRHLRDDRRLRRL